MPSATTDFLQISKTRVQTADGRVFDLTGREPYERKDGAHTELLVWEGLCQRCAAPFAVRTPLGIGGTKAFGLVHCPEHRLSKDETKDRWQASIRASRARKGGAA